MTLDEQIPRTVTRAEHGSVSWATLEDLLRAMGYGLKVNIVELGEGEA